MAVKFAGSGIAGPTFYERVVRATPGADRLKTCLQCGTCSGSCPAGADMDYTPRQLIELIKAGMEDEVLDSKSPWTCLSCYYCVERCPMELPITDMMYTLKCMAVAKGKFRRDEHVDFSKTFIGMIELFGRSFELGLATRYHLAHHPLGLVKQGGLGLSMLRRDRLGIMPERIKNMPQLTAILDEAKRISRLEQEE